MREFFFNKKLFAKLCFIVLPFTIAAQANNTNGDNIDMKFVRFNMIVNPDLAYNNTRVLNGSVTHYFTTKIPNVKTIKFDFYRDQSTYRLIGESFRYHNTTYNLSAAKHSVDTLIIDLPTIIPNAGTLDSVTINYYGNPPQSTGSRGYKKNNTAAASGFPSGVPIISTHSSGFFARQWWPCKHNMTDKIDNGVEFLITTPSAYKAVANGMLQNSNPPVVNNNITWHWKSNYSIAHYLIAMAVSKFTIHNSPAATVNGTTIPIINYLTPAANTTARKANMDAMKGVVEHYSVLFGDYPFKNEKYGHVAYTFGGGMENQTASYIGETVFDDKSILAHELAHQWWGDKVTCLKWNHNWVNEGFARYAEILYSEKFETTSAVISKRQSYKIASGVNSSTNTIYRYDVEVINDNTDHTGKIFASSMVYNKAAMVISMLRKLVGESNFFLALKNYLNDPLISHGYAATEDVQRHFEAVYGKDLTPFFDDFIYKSGYPTYNVEWEYSAAHEKVAIKLNQTKTTSGTYAVTGRYHTVLPIRLRKTTSPIKDTVIVVYDDGVKSLNTMGFKVSFPVDAVEVDPYSESYSYNNTATKKVGMAVVLPVNLIRFNAYMTNNKTNLIWNTSSETAFSHYEVEHSDDGLLFVKLGKVHGLSQSNNQYQFIHHTPTTGYNYYRLKMIDIDGQYKYSNIVFVTSDYENNIKVSPNPANNLVKVTLPYRVNEKNVLVKLINLEGQIIEMNGIRGSENAVEINVSNIPSGSYWLEIKMQERKAVARLLIQH